MRRAPPLVLAALAATAAIALATGCAPLSAPQHRTDPALQALPEAALTAAQRQQWLDRVTWGASDSADAELRRLGTRDWLARQLHPGAAPLPPEAQRIIDALDISRRPMAEIARDLAAQRKAVQDAPSGDDKGRLQQAYQRTLNQLGTDAQKRFVVRALYSPAQLREQMTWFWMNHFNVSLRKADLRAWVGDYEEQAIRPHALGSFRALLEASLRHPAMLRYLDNASNAAGRINENYARELLELHTMGVGSGYTQADVQEMARILTGVGVRLDTDAPPPRLRPALQADYLRTGFFEFNPARHDYGPKTFLGQPMRQRGMAEVEEALDRIVAAPATARFIAHKLAVFFIADEPPPALVQRTAQAFTHSHGGSGFLNRLAEELSRDGRRIVTPMAFTSQLPLTLRGSLAAPNMALASVGKSGVDERRSQVIASMYEGSPLGATVREGFAVRDAVQRSLQQEMDQAGRDAISARGFSLVARRMATLMRERFDLGFVDVGGWDTHVNQGGATGALANRLGELGQGLAGFAQEIGPEAWRHTVVVVISEFGRTFRENGNKGTDHGHGTAYWVLGGGLSSRAGGRIVGEQVEVSQKNLFQNRDHPVLNEYRAVLGGLFQRMYGLNAQQMQRVFAGVAPRDLQFV